MRPRLTKHSPATQGQRTEVREKSPAELLMDSRIVLQHLGSGMFFKQLGWWTQNVEEAFCFPTVTRAFLYCYKHELKMTRIVIHFAGRRYQVAFTPEE